MQISYREIESKWQKRWEEEKCFEVQIDHSKPKFYALDMFPYPSGAGLHVGHLASYIPTDVVSRYKRAKGFNVLHPIGWDAFGLPAEQYAIKTRIHPEVITQKAIHNFKRQLKLCGFSFDWSREVSTCNPKFYKWTQFIFKKIFEKKLAYKKQASVNWCPALKTVLANEEVIDGKSERGDHPVFRKPMEQWMLKITAYAERLLDDLKDIDWPEKTKQAQIHWIGKSSGMKLDFYFEKQDFKKKKDEFKGQPFKNGESSSLENQKVTVFTTRADTLFGVSFIVLAPDHPLVLKWTTEFQKKKIKKYIEETQRKSDVERKLKKRVTGEWTGSYVIHPLNQKKLPVWISDYVLMDYGTGAVMGTPAHDQRDYDFAKKFNLPILPIIESDEIPFEGDGLHIHSEFLNGLNIEEALKKINRYLREKNLGESVLQYKLRDWIFSRQRYWGEPFPLVYLDQESGKNSKKEVFLLPLEELPVKLPKVADYEPTEDARSPLGRSKDFIQYEFSDGKKGKREVDTMPGSAASSWYFLRYLDPQNEKEPFSLEAEKYWMPVDLYVGGPEHSVGHLLYARFWQKILFDLGLVTHKEPFQKLIHQGVILGSDGYRMSKSRGNTVNLDELREKYGVDALRMHVLFLGPYDKDKIWSDRGIEGMKRFLERLWRLCFDEKGVCVLEDFEIQSLNKNQDENQDKNQDKNQDENQGKNQDKNQNGNQEDFKVLKDSKGTKDLRSSKKSGSQKTQISESKDQLELEKLIHWTVKKVSHDIENFRFNTAISTMMELVNKLYVLNRRPYFVFKVLIQLLAPFAPHISEEIWAKMGEKGLVCLAPWPEYDEKLAEVLKKKIGVQVNGKLRGSILISKDTEEEEALKKARALKAVDRALEGKNLVKVVYKRERILNLIAK